MQTTRKCSFTTISHSPSIRNSSAVDLQNWNPVVDSGPSNSPHDWPYRSEQDERRVRSKSLSAWVWRRRKRQRQGINFWAISKAFGTTFPFPVGFSLNLEVLSSFLSFLCPFLPITGRYFHYYTLTPSMSRHLLFKKIKTCFDITSYFSYLLGPLFPLVFHPFCKKKAGPEWLEIAKMCALLTV